MDSLFRWVGHLGFLVGALLGLIALGARFGGGPEVFGFLRATMLHAGTFALALGCAGYLACLVQGRRS